jgi:Domain of unknown function (DUF4375)
MKDELDALPDDELIHAVLGYILRRVGDGAAAAAVGGFRRVGAEQHAALMEEAIVIQERERAAMAPFEAEGTLEAFHELTEHSALGPLDMRYYELPNIEPTLARFIRAHPEMLDDIA